MIIWFLVAQQWVCDPTGCVKLETLRPMATREDCLKALPDAFEGMEIPISAECKIMMPEGYNHA